MKSSRRRAVTGVLFSIGTCASLVVAGCQSEGHHTPPTPAVASYCGANAAAVERRIDDALDALTLDEKILLVVGEFPAPPGGGETWYVPGVPELDIPPFAMIDGPRGVSYLAGPATAFPVAMARGATFDPALEERIGTMIGREVRAFGRNVLLAPTMNVLRHPRWGRAQETYGEDPYHIGLMALGFVAGAQTQVPVTAKHFAVNSIENTRHTVNVSLDERTLREIYLPHFERVVREGHVAGVMSAYNSVGGEFCSENTHLLRDILKGEWEYPGFVVSDWGGTEFNTPTVNHSTRAALAGLDLEMFTERIYGGPLYEAIIAGTVPESQLDEMVRRLFRGRLCFDLDTDPPVMDPTQLETTEARALAREAAERSLVLLRNQTNVLPITRGAGVNIVVTGSLANFENLGDTGSSSVRPSSVVTALEGLVGAAGLATVTHLDHLPTSPADQALVTAADYVIVVAGLTAADEGEAEIGAGDRTSMALPAAELAWITSVAALSNQVVVVLEGGSALTMDTFVNDVEAILFAWYPGVEGGSAIANVIFGDVNPSGRLPIVFPAAESDLPPFDNVSNEVSYGYFHGYRHLDQAGTMPLYPFGYGLSYTTFVYSNLAVSHAPGDTTVRVSFDVTNSGARAGRETTQLYIGAENSAVAPRFVRELRGVEQVELAAGASTSVLLEVPVEDLAYWNETSGAFVVEPTTYHVEVGPNARVASLMGQLTIAP